jgi:hypothetical protein
LFVDRRWLEGGQYWNSVPNEDGSGLSGGWFRFICDDQRAFTVKYDWLKQEVVFSFFLEKLYFEFDSKTRSVYLKPSLC